MSTTKVWDLDDTIDVLYEEGEDGDSSSGEGEEEEQDVEVLSDAKSKSEQEQEEEEGSEGDEDEQDPEEGEDSDEEGGGGDEDSDEEGGAGSESLDEIEVDEAMAQTLLELAEQGVPDTLAQVKEELAKAAQQSSQAFAVADGVVNNFFKFNNDLAAAMQLRLEGEALMGQALARLQTLLVAERSSRLYRDLREGEFDPSRAWKTGFLKPGDDARVFKHKEPGRKIDTAASILVDISGSMSTDGNHVTAARILAAIGPLLDRLRVPWEALGYTSQSGFGGTYGSSGQQVNGIDIAVYKAFEEAALDPTRICASHLNDTPDIAALSYVVPRLISRPEPKRVLFVIADGGINCAAQVHQDALRELVKTSQEKYDLKMFAFGIGVDLSPWWGSNCTTVTGSTLAAETIERLSQALL